MKHPPAVLFYPKAQPTQNRNQIQHDKINNKKIVVYLFIFLCFLSNQTELINKKSERENLLGSGFGDFGLVWDVANETTMAWHDGVCGSGDGKVEREQSMAMEESGWDFEIFR